VERDDHILEEDDVLVSQRDSESGNDTGQNVEKLGGTVELVCFVNECVEALVNCLTNHLSPWHQLLDKWYKLIILIKRVGRHASSPRFL
jgi:hypothetical protein